LCFRVSAPFSSSLTAEFRIITTHQKKAPPTRGWQEKESAKIISFSDEIAATILKSGE
jgi:hypothetical protein